MSFLRFVEKCQFSSLVFDRLVHLQCRVGNMNVGILCAQRSIIDVRSVHEVFLDLMF